MVSCVELRAFPPGTLALEGFDCLTDLIAGEGDSEPTIGDPSTTAWGVPELLFNTLILIECDVVEVDGTFADETEEDAELLEAVREGIVDLASRDAGAGTVGGCA